MFAVVERKAIEVGCNDLTDDSGCKWYVSRPCPHNYNHCCIVCPKNFTCFTHAIRFGCKLADVRMMPYFNKKYGEGFMWANCNAQDHCPINGHGRRL